MARGFEHRAMKEASKKIPNKQVDPADVFVADHLKKWSRTEVQSHVDTAADALTSWKIIQNEELARDYLVSLLIKEHRD